MSVPASDKKAAVHVSVGPGSPVMQAVHTERSTPCCTAREKTVGVLLAGITPCELPAPKKLLVGDKDSSAAGVGYING